MNRLEHDEGPISFGGKQLSGNNYTVENRWGGPQSPWHPGSNWLLGNRAGESVVAPHIKSSDAGESLDGTMTYNGEGPISFRATLV